LFLYGVDAVVEVAGLAAVDGFAGAVVVRVVLEAGCAAAAELGQAVGWVPGVVALAVGYQVAVGVIAVGGAVEPGDVKPRVMKPRVRPYNLQALPF
jgi:hypothetical protein